MVPDLTPIFTQYEKLRALVEKGLVDRVAMDIKAPPEKYAAVTGVPGLDLAPIRESAGFSDAPAAYLGGHGHSRIVSRIRNYRNGFSVDVVCETAARSLPACGREHSDEISAYRHEYDGDDDEYGNEYYFLFRSHCFTFAFFLVLFL